MFFSSPPPSINRSFASSSVVVTLVAVALAVTALGASPSLPAHAQVRSTRTHAAVSINPSMEGRAFPGILLPGKSALLKSKYDGVLADVTVTVGTAVRKGQLLVQLVAEEERVERDRAAAVLKKNEADLERARRLHSSGGTSDEALETAETYFRLAQADLDLARIRLEEHSIRAPFDGVVAERYVDPGASVEAGDPLVRVTALSPLRVEVLLPESMLPLFSDSTVVEVTPSYPETTLYVPVTLGKIVVDPASGTFPLQIELNNDGQRMVPGVSCRVIVPAPLRGPQ